MTNDRIPQALRAIEKEMVELRHHLHIHPELGYEEFATSDEVAKRLEEWGYDVHRGLGGTGVVGQLKRGNGSLRIGIRADMDALPIHEQTDLPYASQTPGKMHACGHDGHTTMLLAAANYLATEGNFSGTLNLIFQPAEEGRGGSKRMIDEGLFEQFPCDAVFGMHNLPGMPIGTFGFRPGAIQASSDTYTITVRGHGGHGAVPQNAVDPIVAAAHIVVALQSIVARNVPPLEMGIISVGAIHAGDAPNVIPETAELRLSVRALKDDVRQLLRKRIKEVVEAQAIALGAHAEIDHRSGYPMVINDGEMTEFGQQVAIDAFGEENVIINMDPVTGSEDFAYMLQACRGNYLFMGNGGTGEISHHSPHYNFNDKGLIYGATYWVKLAEAFLQDK